MNERAQKILDYLKNLSPSPSPETGEGNQIWIRQQTLAEHFGCSRRTIGRCLKELKAANLLTDLNKRHENRCKMYLVLPSPVSGEVLTPEAQHQWQLYAKTFRIVFKQPNLLDQYAQVTRDLKGITNETELYNKTFSGIWALQGYFWDS